jgi:hypothetical protein
MATALNTIGSHKLGLAGIAKFVFAGNAVFTVVSKKTGKRLTFKVQLAKVRGCSCSQEEGAEDCSACVEARRDPRWFVKVMTGSDNESERSYEYIGFAVVEDGAKKFIYGGRKAHASQDADSVKVAGWLVRKIAGLESGDADACANAVESLRDTEVWHEGVCGRCAHRLTVPESIETGLGPICASRS